MNYEEAKRTCHVRNAIFRTGNPGVRFYKNHSVPLDMRVSATDKAMMDWEEYDPIPNYLSEEEAEVFEKRIMQLIRDNIAPPNEIRR